jgi:hypothetical protein
LRIITVTADALPAVTITGANFIDIDTVITLEETSTPGVIVATPSVVFTDANNIGFDASGIAAGDYDVLVANIDGTSFREVNSLTIP